CLRRVAISRSFSALRMSSTADRLSGAWLSFGALVVTSILAGIDGSSRRVSGRSGPPAAGPPGGRGGGGPPPVVAPRGQAASPASAPSKSIRRICPNTSTAIMCATLSLARPTALVIHDDGEALDVLTQLFESSGFEVHTAVSGFRAQSHLEGDRPIDVVVVPWDAAHPVGGDVYRWSLQRRYDLRDGFVFLAAETPPDFDRLVAGRCLGVSMAQPSEVVRVATAAVRRRRQLEIARDAALDDSDGTRPTLLLADDEPVLLNAMAELFGEAGYSVSQVESGHGAIVLLANEDFDAIVTDWNMD